MTDISLRPIRIATMCLEYIQQLQAIAKDKVQACKLVNIS